MLWPCPLTSSPTPQPCTRCRLEVFSIYAQPPLCLGPAHPRSPRPAPPHPQTQPGPKFPHPASPHNVSAPPLRFGPAPTRLHLAGLRPFLRFLLSPPTTLTWSADSFADQRAEVAELAVLGMRMGRKSEWPGWSRAESGQGRGQGEASWVEVRSEAGSSVGSRLHRGKWFGQRPGFGAGGVHLVPGRPEAGWSRVRAKSHLALVAVLSHVLLVTVTVLAFSAPLRTGAAGSDGNPKPLRELAAHLPPCPPPHPHYCQHRARHPPQNPLLPAGFPVAGRDTPCSPITVGGA